MLWSKVEDLSVQSVYCLAHVVSGYGDFVDRVGQSEDFNYTLLHILSLLARYNS